MPAARLDPSAASFSPRVSSPKKSLLSPTLPLSPRVHVAVSAARARKDKSPAKQSEIAAKHEVSPSRPTLALQPANLNDCFFKEELKTCLSPRVHAVSMLKCKLADIVCTRIIISRHHRPQPPVHLEGTKGVTRTQKQTIKSAPTNQ